MRPLLAILVFASAALAADIPIRWDASPTPGVTNYSVYIRSVTNALGPFTFSNRNNGSLKVNVGTNTTAIIQTTSTVPSYVVVTAKVSELESDLSNSITVSDPPVAPVVPPSNLRIGP